jgi:hypothetical protein
VAKRPERRPGEEPVCSAWVVLAGVHAHIGQAHLVHVILREERERQRSGRVGFPVGNNPFRSVCWVYEPLFSLRNDIQVQALGGMLVRTRPFRACERLALC